ADGLAPSPDRLDRGAARPRRPAAVRNGAERGRDRPQARPEPHHLAFPGKRQVLPAIGGMNMETAEQAMTDHIQEARRILAVNDRGGYTVPTDRLYPFQWNWDSAFVAMGFALYDVDRAYRELERLAEGQWADGMI